jgi:membrane-bound serine protease (ClpP class)
MGVWRLAMAAFGLFAGLAAFAQTPEAPAAQKTPRAALLSLSGAVTPANADYLAREIAAASARGDDLIVIEIDTPGGLVDSMKTIVKAILASDTPVATYVAPSGARSASAGLYIMYAAHVSAMAPSTNTGAATPIEIGGAPPADETPQGGEEKPLGNEDAMRAKAINDSVAYIRALAETRGRNADWAEKAVREAASITADEALKLGAIDLIAKDLDDLMRQIDGRVVTVKGEARTIATKGIVTEEIAPTLMERILAFIADPNVAIILMSLGTTGLIIEMWNPGSIFPGAVGATCLLLGLYALQVLPFNGLPLALIAVGAVLVIIEAYSPTFGLAGLSGLALIGAGLYFSFPNGMRPDPAVLTAMLAGLGALLALVFVAVVRSRAHGPMIGGEAIRRREGVVDQWDGKEGWVIVEGERWRARADRPMTPGERIRVVEVDGLVLVVKQAKGEGLIGALMPSPGRAR